MVVVSGISSTEFPEPTNRDADDTPWPQPSISFIDSCLHARMYYVDLANQVEIGPG